MRTRIAVAGMGNIQKDLKDRLSPSIACRSIGHHSTNPRVMLLMRVVLVPHTACPVPPTAYRRGSARLRVHFSSGCIVDDFRLDYHISGGRQRQVQSWLHLGFSDVRLPRIRIGNSNCRSTLQANP